MAVTGNYTITVTMAGDVEYTQTFPTVFGNAPSPGDNQLITLVHNQVNPLDAPATAVALLIIPPLSIDNPQMYLKPHGIGSDVIQLNLSNPTLISFNPLLAPNKVDVTIDGDTDFDVRVIWL